MENDKMLVTLTVGQLRNIIKEEITMVININNPQVTLPEVIDKNEVMTISDLAKFLKCTKATIHAHRRSGKIPKPFQVGRKVVWRKVDILGYLSKN